MSSTIYSDRPLYEEACARSVAFLESLPERPVRPSRDAVARLAAGVDRALPEQGRAPADVLAELDALATPATVASAGPRYFGFVTGGALPAALAAHWLAGAWDQNAFNHVSSPAGVWVEEIARRWLVELLGLPPDCAASFTTGASLANFTALAAARHALLARQGWDVEAHGLRGAPPVTVVVSEESHPTVRKALGLLGLGREPDVVLAVDTQGRIDARTLPRIDGPAIVCAQAGNVNSGASDPFGALREWCDGFGGWLHVDGAFGLWAAVAPSTRPSVAGVERADSWATDAHKWLNVPYDSGLAFVRDGEALAAAMAFEASYLPVEAAREPFHTTAEASRRARGVEIWAALRHLGRAGVADLVERCCRHARHFAEALEGAGWEVCNEVVLNQVVVSFGDADATRRVIERIQEEGVCWCGPTHWNGRDAMRISVSSWATRDEDVERSLASILRAAAPEAPAPRVRAASAGGASPDPGA